MAFDLPRLAARLSRRPGPILFPTFDLPGMIVSDLFRIYVQVPRAWAVACRDRILPAYRASLAAEKPLHDAIADDVRALGGEMDMAESQVARLILRLTPEMNDWTLRAEKLHRSRFVGSSKTATGVDLSTILSVDGVETTLDARLQANVSLIRAVSDDIRKSVADSVFRAFTSRRPIRELASEINAATFLGRKRSLIIARDQTTKLAASLDRERQEEIGIKKFVWRHSGKLHYRPEHLARDGKIYSWQKNNLHGDYPGVAINCGCKSQAYINLEE